MPQTPNLEADACSVCGEGLEPHTVALCSQCGSAYHLNQRQDLPGKDCGDVWISEEHMALEFACNSCIEPAGGLDDVLDLDEAAQLARQPANELAAAAERGSIAHRKTSGGVYLFRRADVMQFAAGQR